MAKFRKNHSFKDVKNSARGARPSPRTILLRSIFFFIGICIMLYLLSNVNSDSWENIGQSSIVKTDAPITFTDSVGGKIEYNFLPESTTGIVVNHKYYTLSYSEAHEQAEWVAYKLTAENLSKPRVKRAKRFRQDDAISTLSAKHSDYTRSGYTRGHLAPAGDMAFSDEAMKASFYMSNMSPQLKAFNGGIWRELEENIREWAKKDEELYIVTGPILEEENLEQIGFNEVTVPKYFYKIILDIKEPEQKAIAFLMPNEKSTEHIKKYAVSIDEIEKRLGINFFADFLPPELETELEKMDDTSNWSFSEAKFRKRLQKWNSY